MHSPTRTAVTLPPLRYGILRDPQMETFGEGRNGRLTSRPYGFKRDVERCISALLGQAEGICLMLWRTWPAI